MNNLTVLLGFLTMLAVCSSYPRRSQSATSYLMKQSRLRQSPPRRPAVRSRLSIPLKPNTSVRHHMSVKKVPAPDGLLNIIKQTVVLKSQNNNKGKRNYGTKKRGNGRQPSAPYSRGQSYNQPPRHSYNNAPSSYPGSGRRSYKGNGHGQASGSNGHSGSNYGSGKNVMNNHPSILPALTTLNKNLGGLIDVLRAGNQNAGHPQTHADPHPAGTAMPIIVVDNTGYGHGQGGFFGPSHPTSMPGSGHAGHFPGSMTVSPFSPPKSSQMSHSSPPKSSHNELLILPNGPNTKSIRISTKGRYSFAKSSGSKNNNAVILVEKKSNHPAVRPTLSGEDPPEVGEAAEP